jgi:hypothetical protein
VGQFVGQSVSSRVGGVRGDGGLPLDLRRTPATPADDLDRRPRVNALAHRWLEDVPVSLAVDERYYLQMDPDFDEPRASIWGMDNTTTQIAVSVFVDRFMPRFLDHCAAITRTRIGPDSGTCSSRYCSTRCLRKYARGRSTSSAGRVLPVTIKSSLPGSCGSSKNVTALTDSGGGGDVDGGLGKGYRTDSANGAAKGRDKWNLTRSPAT